MKLDARFRFQRKALTGSILGEADDPRSAKHLQEEKDLKQ